MSVRVFLRLPSGARQQVSLPDHVELERLLPALVNKLALPTFSESGQALQYELRRDGEAIPLFDTFETAAIAPDSEVELAVKLLDWAVPRSVPEPIRIESWEPTRQDSGSTQPETRRANANWFGRNWRPVLLFGAFLIWRLIGGLTDRGLPQPANNVVSVTAESLAATTQPVATITAQAPAGSQTLSSFADQPIIMDDYLLYLRLDDEGYGLWRVPLGVEDPEAERVMTVNRTRNPAIMMGEVGGVLYLDVNGIELWYLLEGGGDPQRFPVREAIPHAPVRMGDSLYFRRESVGTYQPLHVYANGPLLSQYPPWSELPAIDIEPDVFVTPTISHTVTPTSTVMPKITIESISTALALAATVGSTSMNVSPSETHTLIELPTRVNVNWHESAVILSDVLYFPGWSPEYGLELWRTDGTVSGTYMVKNIREAAQSSFPGNFVVFNGLLYFSAINSEGEAELWRTDGTTGTTLQLLDQNGDLSGTPLHMRVVGDQLFFSALTGADRHFYRLLPDLAEPVLVDDELERRVGRFGRPSGSTTDSHYHVSTNVYDRSFLVVQRADDSADDVEFFNFTTLLRDVYVSGQRVLVQSESGAIFLYQTTEPAFIAVEGAPDNLAVVPVGDGSFLLMNQIGDLFQLDADSNEVGLILNIYSD